MLMNLNQRNPLSLLHAIAIARLVFTANPRPLRVNRTEHGAAIERCAPTIGESMHNFTAPSINFNEFWRYIIVAHNQHYF